MSSLLVEPTITMARSSSADLSVGGGPLISRGFLLSFRCSSGTISAIGNLNPALSGDDIPTGKKFLPVPSILTLASSLASTLNGTR